MNNPPENNRTELPDKYVGTIVFRNVPPDKKKEVIKIAKKIAKDNKALVNIFESDS